MADEDGKSDTFVKTSSLQNPGIQSVIDIGHLNGLPAIRKRCGRGLPAQVLHLLAESTREYRERLREAGIQVPLNHAVSVIDHEGGAALEIIDEFLEGQTVHDIIMSSPDEDVKSEAWRMMLSVIAGNCRNHPKYQAAVMLDAKPPNFLKVGSMMYYVDVFPPMLRDEQGLIAPYIVEVFKRNRFLMTFNFGDIRGQLTKLLALTKIDYHGNQRLLETTTLQMVETMRSEVSAYVLEQFRTGMPHMAKFYAKPEEDAFPLLKELLSIQD